MTTLQTVLSIVGGFLTLLALMVRITWQASSQSTKFDALVARFEEHREDDKETLALARESRETLVSVCADVTSLKNEMQRTRDNVHNLRGTMQAVIMEDRNVAPITEREPTGGHKARR